MTYLEGSGFVRLQALPGQFVPVNTANHSGASRFGVDNHHGRDAIQDHVSGHCGLLGSFHVGFVGLLLLATWHIQLKASPFFSP
jgi:hypothetical protein